MTVRTFYRLDALLEHADTLLSRVDAVSIDIFDTVFIRRIHDPDIVKFSVSRFITESAAELGINTTWQSVLASRNRIEAVHRKRNGKSFPDHEARYDDYMSELLTEIFADQLPNDFLDKVADYELNIEDSVIVVRDLWHRWIKQVAEQGKRIFLISDIYLPAKYLQRLVAAKGLSPHIEAVVSSADSFNAKASGAAYPLLADTYGLSKQCWLHIGDNPVSDGSRASEFGITALVLRDIAEKQRKGIARSLNYFATQRNFWRGRYLQQIMLPLEGENQDREPLYADGYSFFGFLMSFFIHALIERVRELGVSRVYFCSREGWIFKECWNRIAPRLFGVTNVPEARYLYVSRMALANAACANTGMTALNARVALLPAENRDFRDICRVFGLDIERLRPALERAGIVDDDWIDPRAPHETIDDRHKFAELAGDSEFQTEVRSQGRASQQALEAYLEKEGFFEHDDAVVVDVGWLGTIQHFLNKAIEHRSDKPHLHGIVLAATRQMPYPNSFESYTEGLIFDQTRLTLPSSTLLYIKELLEEICRAPHPTLLKYQMCDGDMQLNFRTEDDHTAAVEREQNEYYRPLHEGIFDAATRYGWAVTLFGYSTVQLRPWLNFLLLSRVAFPRTSEVQRVKHLAHQDEFAGRHHVPRRIQRQNRSLWNVAPAMLRFNPFIRLYHIWRHLVKTIQLNF